MDVKESKRYVGVLKWFNEVKQFGFITPILEKDELADSDIFVHNKDLNNCEISLDFSSPKREGDGGVMLEFEVKKDIDRVTHKERSMAVNLVRRDDLPIPEQYYIKKEERSKRTNYPSNNRSYYNVDNSGRNN
ncbi:cold shock protein CspE [Candidatus Hepatincolaceae symbiont of Richtersius coronifer]